MNKPPSTSDYVIILSTGKKTMPYERLAYDKLSGKSPNNPRRQVLILLMVPKCGFCPFQSALFQVYPFFKPLGLDLNKSNNSFSKISKWQACNTIRVSVMGI